MNSNYNSGIIVKNTKVKNRYTNRNLFGIIVCIMKGNYYAKVYCFSSEKIYIWPLKECLII